MWRVVLRRTHVLLRLELPHPFDLCQIPSFNKNHYLLFLYLSQVSNFNHLASIADFEISCSFALRRNLSKQILSISFHFCVLSLLEKIYKFRRKYFYKSDIKHLNS